VCVSRKREETYTKVKQVAGSEIAALFASGVMSLKTTSSVWHGYESLPFDAFVALVSAMRGAF